MLRHEGQDLNHGREGGAAQPELAGWGRAPSSSAPPWTRGPRSPDVTARAGLAPSDPLLFSPPARRKRAPAGSRPQCGELPAFPPDGAERASAQVS